YRFEENRRHTVIAKKRQQVTSTLQSRRTHSADEQIAGLKNLARLERAARDVVPRDVEQPRERLKPEVFKQRNCKHDADDRSDNQISTPSIPRLRTEQKKGQRYEQIADNLDIDGVVRAGDKTDRGERERPERGKSDQDQLNVPDRTKADKERERKNQSL